MTIEQEIMEMLSAMGCDNSYQENGTILEEYTLNDAQLSNIITLVQKREREEMVEKIDEVIAKTDDYKEKSGLYEARDIINLIKQND